jgi:hypothetical protein
MMTTRDYLIDKYIAELGLPHDKTKDVVVDCLNELPQAAISQFANVNYGIFKND